MAKNGIKFTDAHTSSAVCTPTRYGILTGRYNWRSSLKSSVLSGYSKSLIKQKQTTIAEMLKTQGYSTAYIGKWHLGWDWSLKNNSFFRDSLYKGNDKPADRLRVEKLVDFSKPIEKTKLIL